jgi:hypothetical protein
VVDEAAATAAGATGAGSGLVRYGRLSAALQLASMTTTAEERGGQTAVAVAATHRQHILYR